MGLLISKRRKKSTHLLVDGGRSALGRFLNRSNVNHDVATKGKDALDMVRSNTYDMVWMNIDDGQSCSRELREIGYTGKIIYLSDTIGQKTRRLQTEKTVDDLIAKPCSLNQIRYYTHKHAV